MISAARRFAAEIGQTHALGLARLVFGLFLIRQSWRDLQALAENGYFGDAFHMPILPDIWLLPRPAYHGLLCAQLALAVLVIVGEAARPALALQALSGLYLLLCDRLQYHHHRYALYLFSFLLALSPCDRTWRLPGRAPAETGGPLWAQRLMQLQMMMIYLASSGTKLIDPDWRAGTVLRGRVIQFTGQAAAHGVPRSLMATLALPILSSALAKLAIGTELGLAIGLWIPRLRALVLWWGVMFHLTIDATCAVDIFSWLSITVLMLFATPDARARVLEVDPARPLQRATARLVAALDWLARFERRAVAAQPLTVIDRDGTPARGLAAIAALARALPLLFPLWVPLAVAAAVGRRVGDK
jgi:hypothetical protein